MGQSLWLHFADEHPCTTYFDVHQGYRVLTHSQLAAGESFEFSGPLGPKPPHVLSPDLQRNPSSLFNHSNSEEASLEVPLITKRVSLVRAP